MATVFQYWYKTWLCKKIREQISLFYTKEGFPDGLVVKNLPAIQETQETQVRSLGWEDPLEEEMATHSSILAKKKADEQGRLAGYSPKGHK